MTLMIDDKVLAPTLVRLSISIHYLNSLDLKHIVNRSVPRPASFYVP